MSEEKKGPKPDQVKALMMSDKAWAEVELFRWCYGELPNPADMRKIDISKALENIADGIISGLYNKNEEEIISPQNLCSVLYYLANNYSFEE